jgi:hypothetical protein
VVHSPRYPRWVQVVACVNFVLGLACLASYPPLAATPFAAIGLGFAVWYRRAQVIGRAETAPIGAGSVTGQPR